MDVLIFIENFDQRFPKATALLEAGGCRLHIRQRPEALTAQDEQTLLPLVQAVIPGPGMYGEALFARLPALRVLCRIGSGMETIDTAYLAARGVQVDNTKGCNANAVAEMALGLMLALLRHIPQQHAAMRAGVWERTPGRELSGQTVGLLGFGLIGQRLAALLDGFGVRLLACDPCLDADAARRLGVTPVAFEALLEQSDVLSLHAPATPENRGLFGRETIARMKPGAVLINTARGALVDHQALLAALESGHLAGAALDAHDPEPADFDHAPWLRLPQVVAMPHMGGTTVESMELDSMTAAEKVLRGLKAGGRQ